jgi:cell division protein FtsI/penicillin-binding protein 2
VTLPDDSVTDAKLSLAANAGEIKKALNADNSPPIYACRAWVNFDGTTVTNVGGEDRCTIRASGNVDKVVRTSSGVYLVTLSTAMPDDDYVANCSVKVNDTTAGNFDFVAVRPDSSSVVRIIVTGPVSPYPTTNAAIVMLSVFR